jgi:hypothetical protein
MALALWSMWRQQPKITVMKNVNIDRFFSHCELRRVRERSVGVTTISTRLQMVCTFIDTLCKYKTCIMRSLRWSSWCYWSADGVAAWKTAGSACSSLGRAVQRSLTKPESWSGWFPLKSWPTCSYRWLQNMSCEHENCSANWSESSSWLKRLPRSYLMTDSQYVLVSSTLVGLVTRYYFQS